MKLGEYIEGLKKLYDEEGDIALFTQGDPEGNYYNEAHYLPEVRLLSPDENRYRPDNLIPLPEEDETYEDWTEYWGADENIPIEKFERVILL